MRLTSLCMSEGLKEEPDCISELLTLGMKGLQLRNHIV